MEEKSLKFVEIHDFHCVSGTSGEALVSKLKQFVSNKLLDVNNVALVVVNILQTYEEYSPIQIYTTDEAEIKLVLRKGNTNFKPADVHKILNILQFNIPSNFYTSPYDMKYYKPKDAVYQFKTYEGEFVYSF